MKHADHCPSSVLARGDDACTCGAGLPVVAPKIDLPVMPPGPAQGVSAPPSNDDSPYADVERSRALAERAEKAAAEGNGDLAAFLLELAREARLLAALQGKWEY